MSGTTKNDSLVSQEKVWTAAARLVAEGKKPTVESIRIALGGGSPNALLTHLRSWRASQAEAVQHPVAQDSAADETHTVLLDAIPEVSAAVDILVQAALTACGRIQSTERRSAEERVSSLVQAHADALDARDRQHAAALAAVQTTLADTKADLDGVLPSVVEAEDLRSRVAALDVDALSLHSQLAERQAEVTALRAALSSAEAAATQAASESQAWREELRQSREETSAVRRALDGLRAELETARVSSTGAEVEMRRLTTRLEQEREEVMGLRRALEISEAESTVAELLKRAVTAEVMLSTASSAGGRVPKARKAPGAMAPSQSASGANDEGGAGADGQASPGSAPKEVRGHHV